MVVLLVIMMVELVVMMTVVMMTVVMMMVVGYRIREICSLKPMTITSISLPFPPQRMNSAICKIFNNANKLFQAISGS